jgi:hypothetical protein
MLMVIFGAGASYDSCPDFPPPPPQAARQSFGLPAKPDEREAAREPWRPPLTNDLFLDTNDKFGAIVLTYPKLHGILPFLRRPQNSRTVEQQLELYLDEAPSDNERIRQLFSVRYYLHDLFRMVSTEWLKHTNRVTNHAALIDQIRHLNTDNEPVCLVSFNYDTLLDGSLFSSGANTKPLERHFDAHPMFKLFKPHGSVDWARLLDPLPYYRGDVGRRFEPPELIEQAPSLKLSDQYVRANATDPAQLSKFKQPIVPAIAIPVQTKTGDTFEWPDGHRMYFEQLLPQVTKILIIGWQGKEAHFLKLLRDNLPTGGITQITHLQVVGTDHAKANSVSKQFIADIRRHVKKEDLGPTQGGFSQFVQQELVDFLFKD